MLKKKLQDALSFVLGPSERFQPEHRIFNAMVFTVMIMGFIAVFQNIFVGLPVLTIILAAVILTFFSVIYAVSRIKGVYRSYIWPVVFMALVFVAFMWIYNEGSAGGTHLFLAIAPLLFILFVNDRRRYVFLLLYLCVTVGLLVVEYH